MTGHQHSSALPTWLALVVAFIAGCFMTTQARLNGELAVDLDNGFVAASISFGSGFVLLCLIMLVFKRGRQGYGRIVADIKQRIRVACTPRHVPALVVAVDDLPRTRSNKLVELALADAVNGRPVRNAEALANPECIDAIVAMPELRR